MLTNANMLTAEFTIMSNIVERDINGDHTDMSRLLTANVLA